MNTQSVLNISHTNDRERKTENGKQGKNILKNNYCLIINYQWIAHFLIITFNYRINYIFCLNLNNCLPFLQVFNFQCVQINN